MKPVKELSKNKLIEATEMEEFLDLLDLDALADADDKLAECRYFLNVASHESDVQRFRWLVSAFFGAAYSYFEICALKAFHGFHDPRTGKPIEDAESLKILRRYVSVKQSKKDPMRVDTGGYNDITKVLYQLRTGNTHHYPLSIMATGSNLPEEYHFGKLRGHGTPALAFCRTAMSLIEQVNKELGA